MPLVRSVYRLAIFAQGLTRGTRYAISAAMVFGVYVEHLLFDQQPSSITYGMFYWAIAVSGGLLDRGSGFLATALSVLLSIVMLIPAQDGVEIMSFDRVISLVFFVVTGGILSVIMEVLHIGAEHASRKQREHRRNLLLANRDRAGLRNTVGRLRDLMRETAHRYRNDLQRLASTIMLQRMVAHQPETKEALDKVTDRITAMGAVNTRLDAAILADQGNLISTATFLNGLLEDTMGTLGMQPIALRATIEDHPMHAQSAVALGLILNEWITNALKYAFPLDQSGTIAVTFRREGEYFTMLVEDDGIGISRSPSVRSSTGLGNKITRSLASQVGGALECRNTGNAAGTRCLLTLPIAA